MKFEKTKLDDVFLIEIDEYYDLRGSFQKIYQKSIYESLNINFEIKEIYFSRSHKDVFRGLHFQREPFDHQKIVQVLSGSVIDFILDLRQNSISFGKIECFSLNEHKPTAIFIGKGFAHGFLSLEDNTIVQYFTSSEQNKEFEDGINIRSFGIDFKSEIIQSLRDTDLQNFDFNKIYFK